MKNVTVWFVTDNDEGRKVARAVNDLGLQVHVLDLDDSRRPNILHQEVNLFIYHYLGKNVHGMMESISRDPELQSLVKLVLLPKKVIRKLGGNSYSLMYLEFIPLPVDMSLFLLLVEKTAIVERYREMMQYISLESDSRIELFQGFLDINRKKVFEDESVKENFESIIDYEKNLSSQQDQLNDTIKEFTLLRQHEFFDLHERIEAEEMLGELRKRELLEAQDVIHAQGNVMDYSSRELGSAREILHASEKIAELSRTEALTLHEELDRMREINRSLAVEVEFLIAEKERLKKD